MLWLYATKALIKSKIDENIKACKEKKLNFDTCLFHLVCFLLQISAPKICILQTLV